MAKDETQTNQAVSEQGVASDRRGVLKMGALAAAAGSVAAAGLFSSSAQAAGTEALIHVNTPAPANPPEYAPIPMKNMEEAAPHVQVSLDIFNSAANLDKGWPILSPAFFWLPAFALVTMTINCYDNGPSPLLPGMEGYSKVYGTVGNSAIYAMNARFEKASKGVGQIAPGVHSEVPNAMIAHTFTVPAMKLNVPVTAEQTATFMFYTDKPGMYEWVCMAPCGVGEKGMGGPMVVPGFMRGYMFVK